MVVKQELYCHGCGGYVQFEIDLELNGNHVLKCPNCGHEHCRVVKDGEITDIRWDSRNGQTYTVSDYSVTYTVTSTFESTSTGNFILYGSWMDSTTTA